jgi:hypothetical protein
MAGDCHCSSLFDCRTKPGAIAGSDAKERIRVAWEPEIAEKDFVYTAFWLLTFSRKTVQ